MAKRNKIIDADLEDEDLPPIGDPDGFDPDEPEGESDEDALAEADLMSDRARKAMESSRKRGKAPRSGHKGRKSSEARGSRERVDHDFVYRPLNSLDAPPPRAGMEQRWIRVLVNDKTDVRNWSKQSRYKWQPRQLDTVPESFNPPSQQIGKLGEVIVVGDLMLCERDARIGRSRRQYMQNQHTLQMKATKRHVKKAERAGHKIAVVDREDMPTTVGRFRRVQAQSDDE